MSPKEREAALAVLKTAYPSVADADEPLLEAIHKAVAAERERCAVIAETYGVVGWLVVKSQLVVTAVHDTQRIIARAIRQAD